jgi:hypothetical protein
MMGCRSAGVYERKASKRMAEIGGITTASTAGSPAGAAAPRPAKPAEDKARPADRAIRDVVALSPGGDKVVNVARGLELAEEMRRKRGDGSIAEDLRLALGDVFRIGRLFSEVLKAGFKSAVFFFRR